MTRGLPSMLGTPTRSDLNACEATICLLDTMRAKYALGSCGIIWNLCESARKPSSRERPRTQMPWLQTSGRKT